MYGRRGKTRQGLMKENVPATGTSGDNFPRPTGSRRHISRVNIQAYLLAGDITRGGGVNIQSGACLVRATPS